MVSGAPAGLVDRWERLTDRERTSVVVLAVAAVLFLMSLGGLFVYQSLSELESENDDIRAALKAIGRDRDAYLQAKSKSSASESRLAASGVQLESFLDQASKPDVTLDELTEKPVVAVPKSKYVERAVDVRIRRTNLGLLAQFLRRVETGPTLVVVTALKMVARDDRHEEMEVELTATTWERAQEKKGDKKDAREGAGKR